MASITWTRFGGIASRPGLPMNWAMRFSKASRSPLCVMPDS